MADVDASAGDGKLPLPDDFFSVPQLNAKEAKYLLGLAKHACKEVVYYSRRSGGPMQWVHLASDDGVEVFQGVDASSTAGSTPVASAGGALTYLRGSCRIHASLDEIADFFKLDTPEKLQGFSQTVGKDLLDHKTLLTLATPTPENPKHFVAVKWTAVESPTKLARNRDFCYLESHDEFIDTASRKRGWVRSIHSIRLPFCPPLRKSHGLIRGSFYRSGFIFIESNSGPTPYVDAVHTLHLDIKGRAPMWAKLLVMKRRIKNIAQVNAYFQMRRLARGPRLLGELELPAKNGIARCQLCETKFGIFHRKWRCRKCGRVICTSCGHHFLIDGSAMTGGTFITASGSGSGNGIVASASGNGAGAGSAANNLKKVRICVQCSESVVFGGMVNDTATTAEDSTETKDVGDFTESRGPVGKRVPETIRPVYDESPGSSATTDTPLDGGVHPHNISSNPHQFSIEENEYYATNEDAAGLADMLDAKRMADEFEEQLKSGRGTRGSSRSIRDSMGPPNVHVAHTQNEKRGHRASNDDVGTTPASDASTAASGLRNPYNQSFELGHKDSLESIRMSGDWGSYGVETGHIHRQPPTHHGAPVDESGGRRTHAERSSALTNSLLSSVDSPSASNSMALAAAANRRSDASFESGNRQSGAPGSHPKSPGAYYSHPQRQERLESFQSDEGWGYRGSRAGSGEEQYFYDAPARDRLISSHDPASLRRFIDQTQRSSGEKSEDAEHEHDSRSTRSLDNEHADRRGDDGAMQRRTHEYFNSRNARLAQLENHVGDSFRHYSEAPSTRSRRNGGSGDSFDSAGSREYDRRRRQHRGTRPSRYDRYDRYEEGSDSGHRGHSRGRGDSDETLSTATAGADDELAQFMAMEAMRLYEQEMGPRLRVTEETKRAALRKMMAVYAQEIERSQQRERHANRRHDRRERRDHSRDHSRERYDNERSRERYEDERSRERYEDDRNRERYEDDRNRERYYDQRDRYRSNNIPRERGRRRGSSVDDIGDDSRSFYMHLQQNMGGPGGAAPLPEQHPLRRSMSDQRYMTSHHQPPPSYDEHFHQNEPRYRGASPAQRESTNGGPPTSAAIVLGRSSIDSSSSDEDDEEVELRRRRRAAKSADAAALGSHEYRDLADISSRTFQELQIKSFGPGNGMTERHHGNGERVEEKQGEREPNHSHRHHSHPAPVEPTPEEQRADRRNNDTIISTVEAHEQLHHNVVEDDNASISNSYHHNDSFIGQPSPRFLQRDSVSTVMTANGRLHRQRTGTTSSSGENHFASSRATDATSTRAMLNTGNGEDSGGLNADSRSASSSSLAGMVMDPDRSTFGSVANSDLPRGSFASGMYARPNSMHEVAESDTFSEMDLSELPHLMRKEDETEAILRRSMALMDRRSVGSRSSFTDLQHWEPNANGGSSGATTASTSNDTSSRPQGNGAGVDTVNEHGLRLSDVPADRDAAIAMGMRSLGGPQHVRQFSDDSSTDSFMRGWGSSAGAPAPGTPSPVSSGSSHHRHSHHRSFGPVPTSVNSEPQLSGNDLRMSSDRYLGHNGTAFSDTSSSFYSDDGDYRGSTGAYPRGGHHGGHHHLVVDPRSPTMSSDRQSQRLSVSEVRHIRKSISELLSEYSDRDSHQPELEPDHSGSGGEPVVPTVVVNGVNEHQSAAFPSEGAVGMSRGSEKIRELFL